MSFLFNFDKIKISQLCNNNNDEIDCVESLPLYIASCLTNYSDIRNFLDNHDLNINSKSKSGETILMISCKNNDLELINYLLNQPDIDVNIEDDFGETALTISLEEEIEEEIIDLIIKKSDINISLKKLVCIYGTRYYVDKLLNLGASMDINYKNIDNISLLMMSITENSNDTTKLLIEKGADVNTQNDHGETALMCAMSTNNAEICEILINYGANIDIKDKDGNTAFEYDSDINLKEIINNKIMIDNKIKNIIINKFIYLDFSEIIIKYI